MRILTTLLGICLALPALAQVPQRLDPQQRKDLAERYGQALQQELGLLKALDQLDRDAVEIDAKIVRLSVERAQATDALTEAEDRRAKAEAQLQAMRRAVQARLRAILRVAQLPGLQFALSHQDFAKSVVQDRLLRRLLDGDRQRLLAYRSQLQQLEARTRERDAALQKLTELDLQLHEQKSRGEQERRDKLALVQQIEDDRKYHERTSRDLDAAHRQLTAQIATLQEWNERKYTFAMVQGKLLPPVTGRVEVGFGERRHPRFGTVTMHRGLDYRTQNLPGVAVRAVFWGRVAFVGWLTGYGETVILDHGRGWHTVYAHLENVKAEVGEVVKARQRIADVGLSGSLKGRYLYFEIRHNGQPVDPAPWFH